MLTYVCVGFMSYGGYAQDTASTLSESLSDIEAMSLFERIAAYVGAHDLINAFKLLEVMTGREIVGKKDRNM